MEKFTVSRDSNTIMFDSATCQETFDSTDYLTDTSWQAAVEICFRKWIESPLKIEE